MNLDLEKLPSTEQIQHFLGDAVSNRKVILSAIGAVVAVIVLIIGLKIFQQVSENNAAAAWETYAEFLDTDVASKTPEEIRTYVANLEEIRDELEGTPVEPWLLKDLGNAHFYLNDISKAREAFEDLRSKFPNHVATIGLKTPMVPSDTVSDALDDCKRQEEFFQNHGYPTPPVASAEEVGGDDTTDAGAGE